MTPTFREDLTVAVSACAADCLTVLDLDDAQAEGLMKEIAGFMRLAGGGWTVEARSEFIEQATADLADVPVTLLAPAIRTARRTIHQAARFVPWIVEQVASDQAKLHAEMKRLTRLTEIAQGEPAA